MTLNIAGKSVSVAAIIAGIGGLLAIVAAPLTWASQKIGTHGADLKGLDDGMNGGKAEIALGVIAVALVVVWLLKIKIPGLSGQPVIPAAVVVVGALMIVVVALVYFTKTLAEISLKDISDMVSAAGGSVSFGIAMILEIVAGVVTIIGGGWAILKKA